MSYKLIHNSALGKSLSDYKNSLRYKVAMVTSAMVDCLDASRAAPKFAVLPVISAYESSLKCCNSL